MPDGWIILDKPLGLGSTQAVGAVKRVCREAGLGKAKVNILISGGTGSGGRVPARRAAVRADRMRRRSHSSSPAGASPLRAHAATRGARVAASSSPRFIP